MDPVAEQEFVENDAEENIDKVVVSLAMTSSWTRLSKLNRSSMIRGLVTDRKECDDTYKIGNWVGVYKNIHETVIYFKIKENGKEKAKRKRKRNMIHDTWYMKHKKKESTIN